MSAKPVRRGPITLDRALAEQLLVVARNQVRWAKADVTLAEDHLARLEKALCE